MLIRKNRFLLISLLMIISIFVCIQGSVIAKQTIIVPSFGGTFEKAQRELMVEDFEKENDCEVLIETSLSLQSLNRLRAEKDDPKLMVGAIDEIYAIQALQEDVFADLDYSKLSNFKNVSPKAVANHGKYIGWFIAYDLIAYNSEYVKDPPKSWEDLLDPKWEGKIIWPDITTSHGMGMLVLLAKLNGGSETNIDPGFEKIKALKPNILTFWTNHDQVARMLNLGEAWIAVWCSDRAYAQQYVLNSPIRTVIPEEGLYYWRNVTGIPKNLKDKELSYKWIDALLSPKVQKGMTETVYTAPLNTTIELDLPADVVEKLMGESTFDKFVEFDLVEVNKHAGEWTERFRREITD